jgi:hypothetical protein
MTERHYDQHILGHYREVVRQSGTDATSTMADRMTRTGNGSNL